MLQPEIYIPLTTVADSVRLAVAPVFLLTGIGAFLNVCASRLSRIVDRSREIEPRLLAARGPEHDRLLDEMRSIDRRMSLVSTAITLSVVSAVFTCMVVALLFAASMIEPRVGVAIAILFIAATLSIAVSFTFFLVETRLGARSVRVPTELLHHQYGEDDATDR
jgi:hypothetical protein